MKKIWKYSLELTDRQSIDLPTGAKILTVQMQLGVPCVWAKVDLGVTTTPRWFRWVGTGHSIDFDGRYIGTIQLDSGMLVFHLFEEVETGQ